ncbi:MAG: ComEC/Rec2 family competence protein [Rudaea sp.]
MALEIHFIDVGQGDATLLTYDSPDGVRRNILVDGAAESHGEQVVAYLREQGIDRLHLVVATHVDDDHIAGLLQVVAQFPVARFWGPDPKRSAPLRPLVQAASAATPAAGGQEAGLITVESVNTYDRLHALALSRGALVEYPEMGHDASYLFPGLEVRVMGPSSELAAFSTPSAVPAEDELGILSTETNNASIVLRVGLGGQFVLLPGDAELKAWHAMIAQWGAGLHARVLKLAHHGSSNGTDQQVLQTVRPRQAVISVGPNSYKHPSAKVLELLTAPVQTLRTDQQGTIVIRFEEPAPVPVEGPPPRSWWQRLLAFLFGH